MDQKSVECATDVNIPLHVCPFQTEEIGLKTSGKSSLFLLKITFFGCHFIIHMNMEIDAE